MHRITLILILCLLLPDMYIYLVYIVKRTRNILWRSVYWFPTVVLVAIYVYYIYMTGDNALSRHPQGIGRLAVAVMLFAVPKTVFMLCSLLGILMRESAAFCHSSFFIRRSEIPVFLSLPTGFLHTTRTGIGYSMFCQYPLWCHCGYHAL